MNGRIIYFISICSICSLCFSLALEAGGGSVTAQKKEKRLPFPKWLTDFTGLKEWPDLNPPYIPLDFIKLNNLPKIPRHANGDCRAINNNRDLCSFDCHKCLAHDDISTCKKLSQTFDDGPSEFTSILLRNLKSKSTFFTLGINVVDHPDTYREAAKRGHVMGSHTWSHKYLPALSNEEIIAQIEWSIWAMNATAGHIPKWFRPPYGGTDNRVRSILRLFGMQNVLWDVDTFDWQLVTNNPNKKSEASIYEDIRRVKDKSNKGLTLEHDVFRKTVEVGVNIQNILGLDQCTVPQCVGGQDYIRKY